MHTNSVRCRILADLMHTNSVLLCRIFADLIIPILCCADYSQTLCTHCAEQISVNQNVAARAAGARWRRRGPTGGGRRRPPVLSPTASPGMAKRLPGKAKLRPGKAKRRPGKATRRPGNAMWRPWKAMRRPGKAMRRPGKAKLGGAAREGEAVRLSALEVLLPAATAAPRASGIQSLSAPRPPLVS